MTSVSGFRRKVTAGELTGWLETVRRDIEREEKGVTFVCIGTDRSTGDSLGPFVGTMLTEQGFGNVIGTLARPCDAATMISRLAEIPPGDKVVAIDACLGQPASVGMYQVSDLPIEPGKSVGRNLPGVGHYGIAAIVNIDGARKYAILQNTSLHRVLNMARDITDAICKVFSGP